MSFSRKFFIFWSVFVTILSGFLFWVILHNNNIYTASLEKLSQEKSDCEKYISEQSHNIDSLNAELQLFRDAHAQLNLDFANTQGSSIHSYAQTALQNGISGSVSEPNIPGAESGVETLWAALNVIKWAADENVLGHKYVSSNDINSVINGVNNIVNTLAHYPDQWPTDGGYITSYFGYRSDPFTGQTKYHNGVDIAVNTGTNVYSCGAGKIYYAGYDEGGYGYFIMVDHGNGLVSLYAHLSKIKVSTGQTVSKGQVIGLSGSTGRSTGPHLHVELRLNGSRITPKFPH